MIVNRIAADCSLLDIGETSGAFHWHSLYQIMAWISYDIPYF